MSTDRDTTRLVRSWLEEGVTALPDRVLDTVLDQLPATPQRRSWWPSRRFGQMNRLTQAAIAAAAVLVVAIVGYNLLPGRGSVGGNPTPAPTPSPAPTPVPSPSSLPVMPNGSLAPGTYEMTVTFAQPLAVTIAAPGWGYQRNNENFVSKGEVFPGSGVSMAVWNLSHVYADSCDWTGTLQEARTSEAIVAALDAQVGHDTSGPTVTTIGGLPATRFEISLPMAFDVATCDSSIVRLWPDAGPNEKFGLPIFPGQTSSVYVVTDGISAETLIIGITNAESSPTDMSELEDVLASIEFLP